MARAEGKALFRRKNKGSDETDPDLETDLEFEDFEDDDDVPAAPARPTGPWDIEDVPADAMHRLDLGGLQIPVFDGVEVRVDFEQDTGEVMSATLATERSAIQVLAFAAPRSAGIWAEIREEILASINGGGGRAEAVEGAWGTELVADVPTDVPGQMAPARFIGVDGPRWFLRALVQGEAANTPSAEPLLFQAFSQVVVVRGDEAMAVRDQIQLHLPKEAVQQEAEAAAAAALAAADGAPATVEDPATPRETFLPPERGPEITEIG